MSEQIVKTINFSNHPILSISNIVIDGKSLPDDQVVMHDLEQGEVLILWPNENENENEQAKTDKQTW